MKFNESRHQKSENTTLIVDYQKVDDWERRSVTVKIYEMGVLDKKTNEYWDHSCWDAIVIDDTTGIAKQETFVGETGYDEAFRWSNDFALNLLYDIRKVRTGD